MNKFGKYFIAIGIFLVVLSVSMIIYNDYIDLEAGRRSSVILGSIKNSIAENSENIISEETIEMKTINIDGYDYIGTITIPSLSLELPIMSEFNYDRLQIAPCRYYGSIYTDDLIICGHSYKSHFKSLASLEQKEIIIFTDVTGKDYIYEVLEIEVLNPKEVSKMIDNEFDLTLYTCTNDGLNRVTIRCNKVKEDI